MTIFFMLEHKFIVDKFSKRHLHIVNQYGHSILLSLYSIVGGKG